jgi:hypothetical protein
LARFFIAVTSNIVAVKYFLYANSGACYKYGTICCCERINATTTAATTTTTTTTINCVVRT